MSFCCGSNTTDGRDVLGLFSSAFSSCLLLLQISRARSDGTRATSCLCLSPVSLVIPVPKAQSAFRRRAQRGIDCGHDMRQPFQGLKAPGVQGVTVRPRPRRRNFRLRSTKWSIPLYTQSLLTFFRAARYGTRLSRSRLILACRDLTSV